MTQRIIKFRYWDGEKMKYLEPLKVDSENKGLICYGEADTNPIAIMQFTGILDNNGKEIYEGDIIAENQNGKFFSKHKVLFRNGFFGISNNEPLEMIRVLRKNKGMRQLEVIGNIYESPELLI